MGMGHFGGFSCRRGVPRTAHGFSATSSSITDYSMDKYGKGKEPQQTVRRCQALGATIMHLQPKC